MSSTLDRVDQLLSQGEAQARDRRDRRAGQTFAKALEHLLMLPGPETRDRLLRAVRGLEEACQATGDSEPLLARAPALFEAGIRDGTFAHTFIARMALDEKRVDPGALRLYVDYLEAGGLVEVELMRRLHQILSFALHVRLGTEPEEARQFVPLLERLIAARPRMTFPKLYLGRYHYLTRNYHEARLQLGSISGRLADRPKVLNIRARCAEKLNLLSEALTLYELSLRQNHHQPHIHFRVGRLLLWLHGDTVETTAKPPIVEDTP